MLQAFSQDIAIAKIIEDELERQQNQIELIASENFTSPAVMAAQGSVLTNKYAEGYPAKRYYGGCEVVDQAEDLARDRLKTLFDCAYANVQPHSGSQANQAVFLSLIKPGEKILGMGLDAGGHLTHGARVNLSGKWFEAVEYGTDPKTHLLDYDQVRDLAKQHRPKLIIGGASAYPRHWDYKVMREIADEVDAYFLFDMAHYAGLIAAGVYPSPIEHAHVVTSTTHKTLRGPRGGIILSKDAELGKKFDKAIFPGLQGGPLMHVILAKAAAFGECLKPEFKAYSAQVIENARAMGKGMAENEIGLVTGGTDCHMLLADLTPLGVDGKSAQEALELAGMTTNKNAIPDDPLPPQKTSGIRVGSPAGTTRGFGEAEFHQIGQWIGTVCHAIGKSDEEQVVKATCAAVKEMCAQFPLYPHFAGA